MHRAKPPHYKPRKVNVASLAGDNPALQQMRSQLVNTLFEGGFAPINRSDGDGLCLSNIEERIIKRASAFVFLPLPRKQADELPEEHKARLFQEFFKAASLVVGKQTLDPHMRVDPSDSDSPHKPIILINPDGSWNPFKQLLNHLHRNGTMSQQPQDLISEVGGIEDAMLHLNKSFASPQHVSLRGKPPHDYDPAEILAGQSQRPKPDFNVCVFCSATTTNRQLIKMAHSLGHSIAEQGWGLITGLGKEGMMGGVTRGAAEVIAREKKGWIGGSSLLRILNLEGPPAYYDNIKLVDDIYTRMSAMIGDSEAFVIMPGGVGTVQELMALLLLKHHKLQNGESPINGKPIVVVNPKVKIGDGPAKPFWHDLVRMAKDFGFADDIIVVDSAQDVVPRLQEYLYQKHPETAPGPYSRRVASESRGTRFL